MKNNNAKIIIKNNGNEIMNNEMKYENENSYNNISERRNEIIMASMYNENNEISISK
jgi:hypothetical protein